ncbi:hypothetical protein C0992_004068 [Termitomyces sp. T32_za158]|nr:hypothetical protein C0992_004068 [Termitomyces sp. T32_za158]
MSREHWFRRLRNNDMHDFTLCAIVKRRKAANVWEVGDRNLNPDRDHVSHDIQLRDAPPRMAELRIRKVSTTHAALRPLTAHSEVFVIVSLTLFLPICLEQFARDNGFLLPERTTPCAAVAPLATARCVVKIGWLWIDTASFRSVHTPVRIHR